MSAILVKSGDGYATSGHKEYQLLTEADIGNLPGTNVCAVGSFAYLSDYSKIWVLGEDNSWRLVAAMSASAGSDDRYNELLEVLAGVRDALANGDTSGASDLLNGVLPSEP